MVVPKRMTEANEQEQKRPLTLRSGGTLGLRRPVETGQVRQSFSHGRSKTVTVEVRKKRTPVPGAAVEPGRPEPEPTVARAQPAAPEAAEPARRLGVPRTLTAEEHATRVRALQDARKADEVSRRYALIVEADRRRQEEERAALEAQERTEEDLRKRSEEEQARKRAD